MTDQDHKARGEELYSKKSITAEFAKWAVSQSPYTVPDDLARACEAVSRADAFQNDDGLGFFWMRPDDVERELNVIFEKTDVISKWNERKNGNQSPFGFVSRYDKPHPDNDFIDLGAMARNIRVALSRDHQL